MTRKALWLNGLLLAVSCGVSLLIAEVVVATFFPQNLGVWGVTRDGLTSHVPDVSVYMNQFGQQITTNSYGMRDRQHAIEKPKDTYRILVLGDSFMEALQFQFDETFPSLLEGNLTAASVKKIEVVNASVSGWGTDDELTYLVRYGLRFQPDLVLIAMTLHNDVTDNLLEEFHGFSNGHLVEKPQQKIAFHEYALLGLKAFLARHSHLMQLYLKYARGNYVTHAASSLQSHVASLITRTPDALTDKGWKMTKQLLDKTNSLAVKSGARMVVFLLPLAIQVSDSAPEAFLKAQGLSKEDVIIDQPQQIMLDWGRYAGVPVIDLLPEFRDWVRRRGDTLFLENDGHWNREGHRLAATVVADRLARDVSP